MFIVVIYSRFIFIRVLINLFIFKKGKVYNVNEWCFFKFVKWVGFIVFWFLNRFNKKIILCNENLVWFCRGFIVIRVVVLICCFVWFLKI